MKKFIENNAGLVQLIIVGLVSLVIGLLCYLWQESVSVQKEANVAQRETACAINDLKVTVSGLKILVESIREESKEKEDTDREQWAEIRQCRMELARSDG